MDEIGIGNNMVHLLYILQNVVRHYFLGIIHRINYSNIIL